MSAEPTNGYRYDAFLLVSFGGPEKHEDVIPFLENVLRGKPVPRERMLEVAEHYYHFDGQSPINDHCRLLIEELEDEFEKRGIRLPIYWGNRNWHPMLADTVERMKNDGVRRAIALATSAFGSYSGCRQYREDIARARASVGEGAPEIEKIPPFPTSSGFIASMTERVKEALAQLPGAHVVYTAHSIPMTMADSSPYVGQLLEAARMVNTQLGLGEPVLVYQSRSGAPGTPWLEPDIADYIRETDAKKVAVVPIGFLSDHMEVLYDLDTEAAEAAAERGIEFVRAGTAGTHPLFISGLCDLIEASLVNGPQKMCAENCCPAPVRPAARPATT